LNFSAAGTALYQNNGLHSGGWLQTRCPNEAPLSSEIKRVPNLICIACSLAAHGPLPIPQPFSDV
jgi:hypothetical protein